jgi:predicted membrane-bound dolichyl-phosphate-mannose-protein mannosyltransferase
VIAAVQRLCARLRAWPAAPLVALALVSAISLGARSFKLDEPCQSPCTTAGDHTLIFDEAYYVNAARVIAGIRPPAGDHYADAPLGTDPNAEHPQGVKLIMAAAIELFGDGPFAWRVGSLLMGSLAILGMFALVRSAGGGRWPALGAATLMACDNLLLVQSRIGTLDIYGTAMMIWAAALYLRGTPVLAGIALAVATCLKEVSPYLLLVLALLEVGRALVSRGDPATPARWRASLGRWSATTFVTGGVFVGLLALMGLIATPYADASHTLITGGPFAEIAHIIDYASGLTSPHGPQGIASYPWQWLIDLKPIVYLRIDPSIPGASQVGAVHPVSDFLGMIGPPILLLAIPAMIFAVVRLVRLRRGGRHAPDGATSQSAAAYLGVDEPARSEAAADRQQALLGVAWFLGTWVPFALQSLIDQRTSYLYYMVIVMPGIYVAVTYMVTFAWRRRSRWLSLLAAGWAVSVLVAAVLMYPFVAAFR